MIKQLLKGFSGVLVFVLGIYLFVGCRKDARAVQYLKNCKKVEPGMTRQQAERIMGDREGADHQVVDGSLEYITPTFARTGTVIYFNSESEIVTEVICGEQYWSSFE